MGAFLFTPFHSVKIPESVTKIDKKAFGYNADADTNYKISDFEIKGYKDTVAEKYAKDNNFKFVAM